MPLLLLPVSSVQSVVSNSLPPHVHHQLPELAQTHAHQVGDAIQPSHSLLSPTPPDSSFSNLLLNPSIQFLTLVIISYNSRISIRLFLKLQCPGEVLHPFTSLIYLSS